MIIKLIEEFCREEDEDQFSEKEQVVLRPKRLSTMSLKLIAIEVVKERKMEMEMGEIADNLSGKKGRNIDLLVKLEWLVT